MDYVKLGNTGLEVSRLCLGCMSYGDPERGDAPVDAPRGRRAAPFFRQALDAGHQLLRHGEHVLRRLQRGDRRPVLLRTVPPRRGGHRDQGLQPDAPGPNGAGLSRKAIITRGRQQPAATGHRLHRPVPDPPLGPRHADRGDARGAARCRAGRQGALPRRLVDVRLAVRQGAAPADAARLDRFVAMQDHYNLLYREEEREMLPLCRDEGIGVTPWSPLARGRLTRDWDETTARASRPTSTARRSTATPTPRSSRPSPESPSAAASPRSGRAGLAAAAVPG